MAYRIGGAVLLLMAGATAWAAPTYDQARSFTQELRAVVDDGYKAWFDDVKALTRAREINALSSRAKALFGEAAEFQGCVAAADAADEYWQSQRAMMSKTKAGPVDMNRIARAGFEFGDHYRACRTAIEPLDKSPKVPAECFRVLDLTKPGAPELKQRPPYCKQFDEF